MEVALNVVQMGGYGMNWKPKWLPLTATGCTVKGLTQSKLLFCLLTEPRLVDIYICTILFTYYAVKRRHKYNHVCIFF